MIREPVLLSVVSLVTAIFLVFLAGYLFLRRNTEKTSIPSICFFLASAVFAGGYGFELLVTDLADLILCVGIKSIGTVFIPAFFLWIAISFSLAGKGHWLNLVRFAIAFSFVMAIAVATNEAHHLYYESIDIETSDVFAVAKIRNGPLFYAQTAFYFLCNIATTVIFARRHASSNDLERRRIRILLAASVVSFAEPFAYQFIVNAWGIDAGPFFLTAVCMLVTYGVLRYGLFDVRNLVRRMIFDTMENAVIVIVPKQEIVDWNPAVHQYFPSADKDLARKCLSSVSDELAALSESMSFASTAALSVSVAGSQRCLSVTKMRVLLRPDYAIGTALILHDITEEKRHVEMLEELATSDSLTGIYNRRQWTLLAGAEMERAKQEKRHLSVLMIDIDFFKEVNDTWGHAVGDAALKSVTTTISGVLRVSDIFGRWGGEEFAIVLPGVKLADAVVTAERLRRSIAKSTLSFGTAKISITVSIGIAAIKNIPEETEDIDSILRRADAALYRAKGYGRNRIETDKTDATLEYARTD